MKNVKLDKNQLLSILIENRTKHVAEYDEAVMDYLAACLKVAKANLKVANQGTLEALEKLQDNPQQPTSYEDSYTRAIRMVELSVDTVIELDAQTFNQLVLDSWEWKQHFLSSNSTLKGY